MSLTDITKQQTAANMSRANRDGVKDYKRVDGDGLKDWNMLLGQMYAADCAIEHPLCVKLAFRLDKPVVSERKFESPFGEHGFYGLILRNQDLQPNYGCTIAPISSYV